MKSRSEKIFFLAVFTAAFVLLFLVGGGNTYPPNKSLLERKADTLRHVQDGVTVSQDYQKYLVKKLLNDTP